MPNKGGGGSRVHFQKWGLEPCVRSQFAGPRNSRTLSYQFLAVEVPYVLLLFFFTFRVFAKAIPLPLIWSVTLLLYSVEIFMILFSAKSLRDTNRNLTGHGSLENVSAFQRQSERRCHQMADGETWSSLLFYSIWCSCTHTPCKFATATSLYVFAFG
jgi:hypothetical protein